MSDTTSNRELFEQIQALAGVDHKKASKLAGSANLIVKTRSGQHGVLVRVNFLGYPEIEFDQRTRTRTDLQFKEIEATGYAAATR